MKITPKEVSLEQLLTGSSTQFKVPEYQRDYAWTVSEAEELFDDLLRSYESDSEYFVGTLVLSKEGQAEEQFEIVDGQQRLATFTILFSVIRAYAKNFEADARIFPAVERSVDKNKIAGRVANISNNRIVCEGWPDNLFVTLNKKDRQTFRQQIQENSTPLLEDAEFVSYKSESRLIKTKRLFYKFFKERLNNKPEGIEYLDGFLGFLVRRVKLISIEVESGIDAYLLFESLNSKGLDLSIADLLKNKLLMSTSSAEEKETVLQNWEDMFHFLEDSQYKNSVDFLRFYWAAFYRPTPKNDLYKEFKVALDSKKVPLLELSSNLKSMASNFSDLTDTNLVWPTTNAKPNTKEQYLSEIGALKYQICLPALLYASSKRPELLHSLTRFSVSFLFRLITIGGNAVSGADDAFRKILQAMKDGAEESTILSHFRSTPKISDQAFQSDFSLFDTENANIARYILTKIHVHQTGQEQLPNSFHLEHILPQNAEKWKKQGFDFEDTKEEDLIYHIGNMTLLDSKINAAISNSPFDEKIKEYRQKVADEEGGTTFPMTWELSKRFDAFPFKWSVHEIRERAKTWAAMAPQIWPLPQV